MDDPDLYEGDMILTADQRMAAEMGMDVDNPLGRGATKGRQWPGGVMAYVIDSSLCKSVTGLGLVTKAFIASVLLRYYAKISIEMKKKNNNNTNSKKQLFCKTMYSYECRQTNKQI